MIRIAIAEDHQSLIDGMVLLLNHHDAIEIIGTANNGEELVNLVKLKQPHIVVTDIRMPKLDGIEATKMIKQFYPEIKIIAFTMFEQEDAIQQMLAAGATGYLLKNSPLQEIEQAITTVYKGGTYFDANINLNVLGVSNDNQKKGLLTKRQLEILDLIALGKTSREIAAELFIGTHTVDTHRKNMSRILDLHGKGELMRYALDRKYKF